LKQVQEEDARLKKEFAHKMEILFGQKLAQLGYSKLDRTVEEHGKSIRTLQKGLRAALLKN
jgi:hypothetical protein